MSVQAKTTQNKIDGIKMKMICTNFIEIAFFQTKRNTLNM